MIPVRGRDNQDQGGHGGQEGFPGGVGEKECASRLTPRILPQMTGYYRQGSLMVAVDRKMRFKAKVCWSNELLEGWGYQ